MKNTFKALKPDLGCFDLAFRFKNKKAFSLIELLISLIIISLILAAFMPLITKKLKASDITVGSFGGGGSGNLATLRRNVTKEDCERFGALYIPAAMNDGDKPICVTKYNVGDNVGSGGVPIAGDVQKLSTGQTCTDSGNCCWKGTTAAQDRCTNDGNYDGCTRTVCQWRAANTSCNSYAPTGTMPGMWRLPKKEEVDGWVENVDKINNFQGNKGLMLCDAYSPDYDFAFCEGVQNLCPDINPFNTSCHPYALWTSTKSTDKSGYYAYWMGNGVMGVVEDQQKPLLAYSNRCVLDSMIDTVQANEKPVGITTGEPTSQADCDPFNALFIDKTLNDGVKSVCVTKYNVGDNGIPLANSVQKLDVGETCTDSGNCCWQGETSGNYSDDGNYSGRNRTVCNWNASYRSCFEYAPKGTIAGMWRLPKKEEIDGWASNLNTLQLNKGAKGLMLCDSGSPGPSSVQCIYNNGGCPGTVDGYCYPYAVWSSTQTGTGSAEYHYRYLTADHFEPYQHVSAYAFSARCVLDNMIKQVSVEPPKPEPKTREPNGQSDCDKYNALFIDKSMNGGKTSVCAMKYNIGDVYIDPIVRAVPVGTVCKGDYCCWQGKTSGNCTNTGNGSGTSYSGCNRTVCTWDASNESCNSYAPDGIKGLWRLPSNEEMQGWANNISSLNHNKGTMGLILCDGASSTSGSVYCWYLEGGCLGTGIFCQPNIVWSSTEKSSGEYYYHDMGTGHFVPSRAPHTNVFSARCVTDKIPVK